MSAEAAPRPRPLDGVYLPPPLHWVGDGFRVHGYFNVIPDAMRRLSPFLLLDYHPEYVYPPAAKPRGVGVHPHRGFETVTLAWKGSVAHHDSAGGGGVIGPGDVQWMTAASGVLHKEYHEQEFSKRGGPFHMAQLWVNLPRADKMAPPRYQGLLASEMGIVDLGGGSTLRVIAGEYRGVRGPAKTWSRVQLFDARLEGGGVLELDFPATDNLSVLVMDGEVDVNATAKASAASFLVFKNEGDRVRIVATRPAHLLVMGGEPIREPIVQYGPFVMNTQREIVQAFMDFEGGKFGHLDG